VSRNVSVDDRRLRYVQVISVGPHVLQADEPAEAGGNDAGPGPYELLLAALGACAGITVRMYADRKQWPLQGVHVELAWAKVCAEDCAGVDTGARMADGIEMEISFFGELSEDQRRRLTEIADRCPVHRTLSSRVQIHTRPAHVAL
jgi:putative redox protein